MIGSIFIANLVAATVTAQTISEPGSNIIVTGERVRDLRERLQACIVRHCPPNEDVDATLAVAEIEFLDGQYRAAAHTIEESLRRNRRFGAQYSEPIADLYRSQARVLRHSGRDLDARTATRRVLQVLREGAPHEDHRHFTARLEIIEMLERLGALPEAISQLDELARRASETGRDDVRRMAEMRRLRLAWVVQPRQTRPVIERLARSTDPARRFEAVSAQLLLAAIRRLEGDVVGSDALLAHLPPSPQRRLLLNPPYEAAVRVYAQSAAVPARIARDFHDTWVDIGYWIDAEGHVGSVEIARHGDDPVWAEPLLEAIRHRRFSAAADGQPSYRLERYSFTAPLEPDGARRYLRNFAKSRVEMMDLTSPAEPGAPPATAVPSPSGTAQVTPPSASSKVLRRGGG